MISNKFYGITQASNGALTLAYIGTLLLLHRVMNALNYVASPTIPEPAHEIAQYPTEGVAKIVDQGNPLCEQDRLGTSAYRVDACCSSTRTSARHIPAHRDNARSSATTLPNEPSSGAARHYLLPPSKYPFCLQTLHICPGDTTSGHRPRMHPSNTASPWEPHRPSLEWLAECAPTPLCNPGNNAFAGLRSSGCRSCFFVADKGKQFIHLGSFDFLGYRRFWQAGRTGLYP